MIGKNAENLCDIVERVCRCQKFFRTVYFRNDFSNEWYLSNTQIVLRQKFIAVMEAVITGYYPGFQGDFTWNDKEKMVDISFGNKAVSVENCETLDLCMDTSSGSRYWNRYAVDEDKLYEVAFMSFRHEIPKKKINHHYMQLFTNYGELSEEVFYSEEMKGLYRAVLFLTPEDEYSASYAGLTVYYNSVLASYFSFMNKNQQCRELFQREHACLVKLLEIIKEPFVVFYEELRPCYFQSDDVCVVAGGSGFSEMYPTSYTEREVEDIFLRTAMYLSDCLLELAQEKFGFMDKKLQRKV